MKKNGFTLAEVLITLAIIGVVATLTLPSLMSNTQEQQAVTAFKKSMNTLNEVAQMNSVVDGFDYSGITTETGPASRSIYNTTTGVLEQSIWAMMKSKAQVDDASSYNNNNSTHPCDSFAKQIFFRDGTVLCYGNVQGTAGMQNSYIPATIDTNGIKGPNIVSSCGDARCFSKASKNIRDQFRITLYGSNAIPGRVTIDANGNMSNDTSQQGYAAGYAMLK